MVLLQNTSFDPLKLNSIFRGCIALLIYHTRQVLIWYVEGYDLGNS